MYRIKNTQTGKYLTYRDFYPHRRLVARELLFFGRMNERNAIAECDNENDMQIFYDDLLYNWSQAGKDIDAKYLEIVYRVNEETELLIETV